MRLFRLCATVAIFLVRASAQVTGIAVTPVTSNTVSIQITGNLPDGCYSDPTVQVNGAVTGSIPGSLLYAIQLNSIVSPGPCVAVITPFTKTAILGPLAPGTYFVSATLVGNGTPTGGTVAQSFGIPIGIPAVSPAVLIAIGIGLAVIRFRLIRSPS